MFLFETGRKADLQSAAIFCLRPPDGVPTAGWSMGRRARRRYWSNDGRHCGYTQRIFDAADFAALRQRACCGLRSTNRG
jgi:hypothetical protein